MADQFGETSPALSVSSESSPEANSLESQTPETPVQEAAPATPVEVKKRLKQLQLKIDGEESVEDLPFEIDEEHADWMRKNLQLSKKANKSMQSEASLRTQVDNFVKSMKTDLKNTLIQMGHDPKEFAAQIIEEEMKQMAMSPEQRERAELEAKLKKLEDERKNEKEDFDKREYERLTQQEYERINTKMTAVIDTAGLPKSPYVVKKIAQYMSDGLKMGVDLQPEDVIDLVKSEVHSDIKELIAALGDGAEEFLGKEIFEKARKRNIAKAKATPASVKAAIKDVNANKAKSAPAEKQTMKEFFGKI